MSQRATIVLVLTWFLALDAFGQVITWSGTPTVSDTTTGPWQTGEVHIIQGYISIPQNETLTINPGVIVKFDTGAQIFAYGNLVVAGTSANPPIFTSFKDDAAGGDHNGDGNATSPAPGDWNSVWLLSFTTGHDLQHCIMRYGGSWPRGIVEWEATGGTMQNVTISDSSWHGIRFQNNGRATSIQNCAFNNCRSPILGVRPDSIHTFSSNTATGNSDGDVMFVDGAYRGVASSQTWSPANTLNGSGLLAMGGPVDITGAATVTINAGVTLKWMNSTDLLTVNGALVCNGSASSKVVMTAANDDASGGDTFNNGATSGLPGDWQGIRGGGSGSIDLAHTEVLFAGDTGWAAVGLGGGGGSLTDCRISSALESGLHVGFGTFSVTGTAFENNGTYAIAQLALSDLPNVTGCTATGNGSGDVVVLGGGTLNTTLTLGTASSFNGTGVFVWRGQLSVGTSGDLTLDPGVIMKADPASPAQLVVHGNLTCNGNATSPVTFTSLNDDSVGGDTNNNGSATSPVVGDWQRIYFAYTATGNLTHTHARWGATSATACVHMDVGAQATLDHCVIEDCGGAGLDANGNAPVLTNCAFNRCTVPVNDVGWDTIVNMVNCTATGNSLGDTVRMSGSTVSGTVTLSSSNTLNTSGVIVCTGGLTVPAGASLTLDPGMIFKLTGGSHVVGLGQLVANGTANSPVVFTSTLDDTYGGDSTGDPTPPSPGDWGRVVLGGNNGIALTHTYVRYAGFGGGAIETGGTDAALTNVHVEYALGAGFHATALTSAPSVTNCSFDNCVRPVDGMSIQTATGFSGCTASGNAQGDVMRLHEVGIAPPGGFVLTTDSSFNGTGVFRVVADITLPDTTVNAGVIFKIDPGKAFFMTGNLGVNGTASSPVVFTSVYDANWGGATVAGTAAPGDWAQMQFNSATGTVNHAYIGYAGGGGTAAVELFNSDITLCNTTIEYSLGSAIDMNSNSAPTCKYCTFINNGDTPVAGLTWPALGKMIGTTAYGNGGIGDSTWIQSSLVGEIVYIDKDNYFGSCVVCTVSPTINPGDRLTFGRGVIVKAFPNVELEVTTDGTAFEKVILTSFKDDSVAGDTNGDGNATQPAPGDWLGVRAGFSSQSHALVRYAVTGFTGSGFGVGGTLLNACRAEYCSNHGFSSFGVSTVGENLVAFQNGGTGMHFDGIARNCTAVGNGGTGIAVGKAKYCIAWNNGGSVGSGNFALGGTVQPGTNVDHVIYSCGLTLGTAPLPPSPFQCPWTGWGNINVDPRFVDEANGDLRLRSDSPCRNFVLTPIPNSVLCDPNLCTPWTNGGCAVTHGYPEAPPAISDYDEYPRPLDDDDAGPAPLLADLGAHERNVYTLSLTGETRLGTTPVYTVSGSPGTAYILAGQQGNGFLVPNVGMFLLDPATYFQFAVVPVGAPLPVSLPPIPAFHDFRIDIQAAIVSPSGALTSFTNLHRVRLHY